MAEITIRRATWKDVFRLSKLDRKCFDPHWGFECYLDEILKKELEYYLIAEEERLPVGFMGLRITEEEAHVTRICVLKEYRGRHVAQRLMELCLEEGKRRGKTLFTLEVRVSNLPAQKLYEKYGFYEKERKKNYYNDEDAITMWRIEESQ